MDDKLRGKKVKDVVFDIVLQVMGNAPQEQDVETYLFTEYSYERLMEFVMEHGRQEIKYQQLVDRCKELWKQFCTQEKSGASDFVDKLCYKYSEDNDVVFELVRKTLIEKLEETDFEDMRKRHWDDLAMETAHNYFWS